MSTSEWKIWCPETINIYNIPIFCKHTFFWIRVTCVVVVCLIICDVGFKWILGLVSFLYNNLSILLMYLIAYFHHWNSKDVFLYLLFVSRCLRHNQQLYIILKFNIKSDTEVLKTKQKMLQKTQTDPSVLIIVILTISL